MKFTTDTTEIQRIIRKYYEQLYANELDNVDEMNKFLDKYNILKLNQEELENPNRLMITDKIEAEINTYIYTYIYTYIHTYKKTPSKQKFWSASLHRGCLPNIQTIPKNPRKGTLSSSFYEVSIILIPKQDKDIPMKELQANTPDEKRY